MGEFLASYRSFTTASREELEGEIKRRFGALDVQFPLGAEEGAQPHICNWWAGSGLYFVFCRNAHALSITFPESDSLRYTIPFEIGFDYRLGAKQLAVLPDKRAIVGAPEKLTFSGLPRGSHLTISLSRAKIVETYSRLTDEAAPNLDVVFASLPGPKQVALDDLLLFSVDFIERHGRNYPEQHLDHLVSSLLTAFAFALVKDEAVGLLTSRADGQQLRQMMAYIEEKYPYPISVADLAKAGRCSIRSVFAAFEAGLGTSPMAYLKKVRLQHARRMILKADGHQSILEISLACGFSNHGHFSKYYREAFGELPSRTIKRRVQ